MQEKRNERKQKRNYMCLNGMGADGKVKGDDFKCLGSTIQSNDKCTRELKESKARVERVEITVRGERWLEIRVKGKVYNMVVL